jgi:hypothetical protein
MTRIMYDATHENISSIPGQPSLIAGYDTGSPNIQWVPTDWLRFPHSIQVHIDQAFGPNTPSHSANVQDVESGAYGIKDIPGWVALCTAPRPTTYVSGLNLEAALLASNADIWLAAPGMTDAEAIAAMLAEPRIVAVQNMFNGPNDRSIVGDAFWPHRKPVSVMPVANLRTNPLSTVCQVNVAWNATPGVTSYDYQLQEMGKTDWVEIIHSSTHGTVLTIPDLAPRHEYRLRISDGERSPWKNFTTP